MSSARTVIILAASITSSLASAGGPLRSSRIERGDESIFYPESSVRMKQPREYQTKREKREMMQRDFEHGGSRQGRRRRQRMYHVRNK